MSQCWLVKLPTPAHKIILLKFADHANDDGLAYPGAIGISEAVGLAERQTRKLIGELRKWGFLKVFEAEDPVKGKPITYRVTPALGCTPALQCTPKEKKTKTMPTHALECSPVVECSPALERRRGCTTAPLPPALECTQTITEPSTNHHSFQNEDFTHAQTNQPASPENHPPDAGANPVAPPAKHDKAEPVGFELFWKNFPSQRKGSRDRALKAYRLALKRASAEKINLAVLQYAKSQEVRTGYAKGAAAWLNDDRYETDYSVNPKNGKRVETSRSESREVF